MNFLLCYNLVLINLLEVVNIYKLEQGKCEDESDWKHGSHPVRARWPGR